MTDWNNQTFESRRRYLALLDEMGLADDPSAVLTEWRPETSAGHGESRAMLQGATTYLAEGIGALMQGLKSTTARIARPLNGVRHDDFR